MIRANGQPITWTGGDPSGSVEISGFSALVNGTSETIAGFECTAPDSAGQFTIPAVVLLSLPAGSAATSLGSLSVGAVSAIKNFTATGLDLAYLVAARQAARRPSLTNKRRVIRPMEKHIGHPGNVVADNTRRALTHSSCRVPFRQLIRMVQKELEQIRNHRPRPLPVRNKMLIRKHELEHEGLQDPAKPAAPPE